MAFNFFYIDYVQSKLSGSYPVAKPTGGAIDVVNQFDWKNPGTNVDEVPLIFLTEYQIEYGQWTADLSNLVKNLETGLDPYVKLYKAQPTGFSYLLPYINSSGPIRGSSPVNEWVNSAGMNSGLNNFLQGRTNINTKKSPYPQLSKVVNELSSASQVIGNFASHGGFGVEDVKKYKGTSPRNVTIQFPLYNTTSVEKANDHFSFVSLFEFQNLKTRTSFITTLPPKIYSLDSFTEGGVFMPVAVVSNLTISPIGTLHRTADTGTSGIYGAPTTRLIPEAYNFSVTFTELLPDSANIMAGVLGGNKVSVITD